MSGPPLIQKTPAWLSARAVVAAIDQGTGAPLDWDGCVAAVQHLTTDLTRAELVEVIAYLGALVVAYRQSVDQDPRLAMVQIGSIVDEYRRRHRGAS